MVGEGLETGLFDLRVEGRIGKDADQKAFVRAVGYDAGSLLHCAGPGYAGDYGVGRVDFAEGLFVADAILDYDEGCLVVCDRLEEGRDCGGLNGFVDADDEIKSCIGNVWYRFVDWTCC